ncbi:MAG TPA: hypothetical protein VFK09_12270 [Gemmatimonadales bacterium]|nr:hypothetical protein [Gemmatimonadales bacterium]
MRSGWGWWDEMLPALCTAGVRSRFRAVRFESRPRAARRAPRATHPALAEPIVRQTPDPSRAIRGALLRFRIIAGVCIVAGFVLVARGPPRAGWFVVALGALGSLAGHLAARRIGGGGGRA